VRLPASHEDRTAPMCLACHDESVQPTFMAHSREGKDPCSQCHSTADDALVRLPSSHAGRTDRMCNLHHEIRPEGVPAVPHTLQGRVDFCTICHSPPPTGLEGLDVPASHKGETPRTQEMCLLCHEAG
jgi:hypothetical protein